MRSIHTTNQQDYKNNTPYRVIHKHRTKLGNPIRGIIVPTSIIPITIITLLSLFSVSLANIIGSSTTYAEGSSVSLSIDNSDTVLELTIPSSVSLDLTPSSANNYNPSGTASLSVSAGTNNITGYNLTMSVPNTNLVNSSVTITNNPNNIPLDNSNHPIIPTIANTYSDSNFPNNAWGYRLSTSANYSPVSSNISLPGTNSAGNATTTTIELAAKVNSIQPAGTYTTTFNIAATAKQSIFTINWNANGGTVSPTTSTYRYGSQIGTLPEPTYTGYDFLGWFTQATGGEQISEATTVTADVTYWAQWEKKVCEGYQKMQDIATIKSSLEEEAQTQLCDARDEKIYWVAKLKDGNVWMTQNLDLDLSTTKELTSADTNLPEGSSWTPDKNTVVGDELDPSNWATNSDYTHQFSWDGGNYYLPDGRDKNNTACTNKDLSTCTNDVTSIASLTDASIKSNVNAHYHIGNLYTWTAAIAMNNSSSYSSSTASNYANSPQTSICPKGWRLPNGASNGDFKALNNAYGGNTSNDDTLRASPLYFVCSGYVGTGSLGSVGSGGFYWSSTVNRSDTAYNLYFYSTYVFPANNYYRRNGYSVRCVAQ